MKKSFIEKTRKALLEQKAQLESKSYHHDIDTDGDETDEIQGNIIATVNNKLSSMDRDKMRQIENALKKIENATYGACEECGEQIAEKRLEHNPHYFTCIICAEQKEFDSKQRKR